MAIIRANTGLCHCRFRSLTYPDRPCVTKVHLSMSHADRTPTGHPRLHSRAETRCLGSSGATLMAMNATAKRPGQGAGDEAEVNGSDGRLAAYEARTQTPLDLLALATLWIAVVPTGE